MNKTELQREDDKEQFENCLIYLGCEPLDIQEFLDEYYQNEATPHENLMLFIEFCGGGLFR